MNREPAILACDVGGTRINLGVVVRVHIDEILPNVERASGSATACFHMWALCAMVSWSFPVLAGKSAALPFLFFAGMMVLQFFLVWIYLPETKGVSLEDLQRRLNIKN